MYTQTVRNALLASKPGGTRYLNMTGEFGKEVLWNHVVKLYDLEKSMPLTVWTRLTNAHIHLNNFSKVGLYLIFIVLELGKLTVYGFIGYVFNIAYELHYRSI